MLKYPTSLSNLKVGEKSEGEVPDTQILSSYRTNIRKILSLGEV